MFDFFLKIYADKVDRFLTNDFSIVERAKRNKEKTSEKKKIKKIAAIDQTNMTAGKLFVCPWFKREESNDYHRIFYHRTLSSNRMTLIYRQLTVRNDDISQIFHSPIFVFPK